MGINLKGRKQGQSAINALAVVDMIENIKDGATIVFYTPKRTIKLTSEVRENATYKPKD